MKERCAMSEVEMQMISLELGKMFVHRWFVPDILGEQTKDTSFLESVGKTLKFIGNTFPKPDPRWPGDNRWENKSSVLNLADLQGDINNNWSGGNTKLFKRLWRKIKETLETSAFYFPKGAIVPIQEYDLLVTTPIAQAKNHMKEAEDAKKYYKETGKLDYYWRRYWPPPKNLRIGSKMYYVDNRVIRGFGVVTDIVIDDLLEAHMLVDTWRWIKPIPCNYSLIKPPQSYAKATEHLYLKGVAQVKVVGNWLDPMPKE